MLLSVGNGAPEQVGWTLNFLVMFLDSFWPTPKSWFPTRKSKSQPVYAIGVGYFFVRYISYPIPCPVSFRLHPFITGAVVDFAIFAKVWALGSANL